MIIKLRLKNWRSHLDSEFKFSKGVNALFGIIGSGKSSVMDALCFSLFGTFPTLSQKKLKLDEVLRNKPSQARKAEVELDFIKDREVYQVYRAIELNKGTTTSNLRKNGKLVEGPNSQRVSERVSDILKIDYDIFSRAVYSEQNQMDYFLNIPKGQRMAKIDRLLRIDRFETARKTSTSLINKLSEELDSKERVSEELISEQEKKTLAELKKGMSKAKDELEELGKELDELLAKKGKTEKELESLKERAEELKELEVREEGLKGQITELREHIDGLKLDLAKLSPVKIETEFSELSQKLEKFEKSRSELDELESEIVGLESTIEVLETELESANQELAELGVEKFSEEEKGLEKELIELEQEHGKLNLLRKKTGKAESNLLKFGKKIEACKTRIDYSKHILEDLKTGKKCPLCKAELKKATKEELLKEHDTKLNSLELNLNELTNELAKTEQEQEELERTLSKFSGIEERLSQLEKEKSSTLKLAVKRTEHAKALKQKKKETEKELKTVNASIKKLEKEFPNKEKEKLEERLEELNEARKALGYKEKIVFLENDLKDIQNKQKKLSFDREDMDKANKEYNEILVNAEKCRSKIESSRELLEERKKRFEELNAKKELMDQYRKDIKWLKENRESLSIFQNALKRTQESLRKEFIGVVNEVMSEIWSTLYPYGDLSSVKLIIDEGDYVLKTKTSTGWVNIEGIVSGGERSLASLALRIAFSLALAPNLSWLVLDEPTHNLDLNSIDELSLTLRERLPTLIDQIFLITHEERLESAVSGYLYKLERDKALDEPTKVILGASPELAT